MSGDRKDMVTIRTLATLRNDHVAIVLGRADSGQLMLAAFDSQLNSGTTLMVGRGDLLKWAREIIKAVGN